MKRDFILITGIIDSEPKLVFSDEGECEATFIIKMIDSDNQEIKKQSYLLIVVKGELFEKVMNTFNKNHLVFVKGNPNKTQSSRGVFNYIFFAEDTFIVDQT